MVSVARAHTQWHWNLSLLAEARGRSGQIADGLTVLEEARSVSASSGEPWRDAELHRLTGELNLARGAPDGEAEVSFRRALEIARRQEARMLELRAAVSFARLWQRQGKRDDARQILGDVYGWFTEGFDTLDLSRARALLIELG